MTIDWGTAPAWIAAFVASSAALVALYQFRAQVQIARANLLLSIDAAYENEKMYKSRKAVRSLRNRADVVVSKNKRKNNSHDALREAICEECSLQLDELWAVVREFNDLDVDEEKSQGRIASDRYSELMALPYWFESVGMLCQRNLLPTPDVLNLYDQVIITTMSSFANHIEARRTEGPYVNPRFLENARWLLSEAIKYKQKRDDPPESHPAKSQTKWS